MNSALLLAVAMMVSLSELPTEAAETTVRQIVPLGNYFLPNHM